MRVKPDSPDMIGPEGNLQLSQDLGGFLQAPLKLTTQRHLVLEHFVKKVEDNSEKLVNSHFNASAVCSDSNLRP